MEACEGRRRYKIPLKKWLKQIILKIVKNVSPILSNDNFGGYAMATARTNTGIENEI